jgi:DNA-binding HxlR family transcriptional regulator
VLRRVDIYYRPVAPPEADYCLTDRGRRDTLINLELLRAWAAANEAIIEKHNQSVVLP